jgi:hypothetical protein
MGDLSERDVEDILGGVQPRGRNDLAPVVELTTWMHASREMEPPPAMRDELFWQIEDGPTAHRSARRPPAHLDPRRRPRLRRLAAATWASSGRPMASAMVAAVLLVGVILVVRAGGPSSEPAAVTSRPAPGAPATDAAPSTTTPRAPTTSVPGAASAPDPTLSTAPTTAGANHGSAPATTGSTAAHSPASSRSAAPGGTTSTTAGDDEDSDATENVRTGDGRADQVSGPAPNGPSLDDRTASSSPRVTDPALSWWPSFESLWPSSGDTWDLWAEPEETDEADEPDGVDDVDGDSERDADGAPAPTDDPQPTGQDSEAGPSAG